jgi:hypothetical protein
MAQPIGLLAEPYLNDVIKNTKQHQVAHGRQIAAYKEGLAYRLFAITSRQY